MHSLATSLEDIIDSTGVKVLTKNDKHNAFAYDKEKCRGHRCYNGCDSPNKQTLIKRYTGQ